MFLPFRPLVQTMYGEAAALAEMFAEIGDEASAAEMAAEARAWQTRVLQQWNANLSSFDTIHPDVVPMPPGWNVVPGPSFAYFVPGSPHAILIELRQTLISCQDHRMLSLSG